MEKKKKIWAEPKLTALVRRKPEEGILSACKTETDVTGPAMVDTDCRLTLLVCGACLDQAGS